jgi:hypothetical protein
MAECMRVFCASHYSASAPVKVISYELRCGLKLESRWHENEFLYDLSYESL